MTTATLPPASPPAPPALVGLLDYVAPGDYLVKTGVTFAEYEQLIDARTAAGRRGVKIAYDNGVMEIMVVSGIHERLKKMEKAADALPIEQIASRWIVGSDPDKVVGDIKKYVDAGFTHLVFHGPGADQRRFLDLFEKDLAPRLRAL